MQNSSQPKLLPVPFADAGSKQDIPNDSQIGATAGRASYTDGFPPLTRTPLAAGGVPPFGTDFNGVLNDITAAVRWSQAGAGYPFNAAFNTAVSGYPKGARIPNSTLDGYWLNTTDGNTANPEVSGAATTGWVPAENYGVTAVTGLSGSSMTLTTLQASKERITLAGTLTANINLVLPAWRKKWMISNGTSGKFTVTVKTPSGSGVAIQAGMTAALVGDGTNISLDNQTLNISSQVTGVVGLSRNARMSVTTASATATFQADELALNTVLGGSQYRAGGISASINLGTTGAGGMDTGSAPVTGYVALYVILNPTSGVTALLGVDATSSIAPEVYGGSNMPSGYTASALVAVWPTASSQLAIGNLIGRKIEIASRTILSSSTVNQNRMTLATTQFPLNAKFISGGFGIGNTAATTQSLTIWGANSSVGGFGMTFTLTANASASSVFSNISVSNQTIGWSSSNTAGTPSYSIGLSSYEI